MKYIVQLLANFSTSQNDGYRQWHETSDQWGKPTCSWIVEGRHLVLERIVEGENENDAISRFIEWQKTGKPEKFLAGK